VTVLNFIKGS